MITTDEIHKLSELIRIALSKTAAARFQKELSAILSFVRAVEKLTVSSGKEGTRPNGQENILREDTGRVWDAKRGEALLEDAPRSEKNFVVVRRVFKDT